MPPTLFFAVGFCLIELTTQLILDNYLVRLANYVVAIGVALVVGKAVLVADLLPFLRRFDTAPLIGPVLFKSVVYTVVVFFVRCLERFLEYWFGGGRTGQIPEYVSAHFEWHRFVAIQLWIFVLFLLYTSAQLAARLGHGELFRMFFRRSPELAASRTD